MSLMAVVEFFCCGVFVLAGVPPRTLKMLQRILIGGSADWTTLFEPPSTIHITAP